MAGLSCHRILTDTNLFDNPVYFDPFFLFSTQFQTLQLFSLLLSLPHLIFHDSSHHLCSLCLHHPSIVVPQSLGLPFVLVISVKSLPFNCHFWNSSPLGVGFFFFTPVSVLLSGKTVLLSLSSGQLPT